MTIVFTPGKYGIIYSFTEEVLTKKYFGPAGLDRSSPEATMMQMIDMLSPIIINGKPVSLNVLLNDSRIEVSYWKNEHTDIYYYKIRSWECLETLFPIAEGYEYHQRSIDFPDSWRR